MARQTALVDRGLERHRAFARAPFSAQDGFEPRAGSRDGERCGSAGRTAGALWH